MLKEHVRSTVHEDNTRLKHSDCIEKYQKITCGTEFTADWFTGNIPFWVDAFQSLPVSKSNTCLRILEIGSFEGRSALFFISMFDRVLIDCVDSWLGSDEHGAEEQLDTLHDRFVQNTRVYSSSITTHRMTSAEFFIVSDHSDYDLVYVDGSHRASDVLLDLVEGFNRLKIGGILMIDDYLWKHYDNRYDNPCIAVNTFCRVYRTKFRFLRVGYQVYVQKTGA